MPNNIYNRLEIIGNDEQVKQVRLFLKCEPGEDGSNGYIDFNNIIAMPEELLIDKDYGCELIQVLLNENQFPSGIWTIDEAQADIITWSSEKLLTHFELISKLQDNIEKYGYPDWYEWRCANWGTKWNAYCQSSPAENIITFSTAWGGVPDLMAKLSSKFPEVKFNFSCDDYYDSWIFEIQNGEIRTQKKEEIVWVPVNGALGTPTS